MMKISQKKLPLFNLKIFMLLLLPIVILRDANILKSYSILQINILYWTLGFVLVIIWAFFIHYMVYYRTLIRFRNLDVIFNKKEIFNFCFRKNSLRFKNLLLFFISPDYIFAKIFKEILEEPLKRRIVIINKEVATNGRYKKFVCSTIAYLEYQMKKRRKLFIIMSNWANIIFASVLVIFVILEGVKTYNEDIISQIFFTFVILHTFSRAFEICYAFYNDVVSTRMTRDLNIGEKLSTLKRGNRISLAVHSYLEITLLFSLIYYLGFSILCPPPEVDQKFIDYILYSFSVSAFNFSFDSSDFTTFGKVLHVTQVFTCIILVVLSIANYMGYKDRMSDYEKSDWKSRNYI
ncbi:hypothetical protein HF078_17910 [Bacillus sp. RO2]|uniref:hypothetical protein n=1 Tax=Bacillus sp. RO2 TaxID=2723913 RepID=UPI00145C415F|nr:hypothetical protein [Bacillus sp. RO2]NMH74956.1 hypothetical protein [Bacillus sp. RO2]